MAEALRLMVVTGLTLKSGVVELLDTLDELGAKSEFELLGLFRGSGTSQATPQVAAVASLKPGSSDQRSEPITLNRGSSVSRSMRTRSIAPGAAR